MAPVMEMWLGRDTRSVTDLSDIITAFSRLYALWLQEWEFELKEKLAMYSKSEGNRELKEIVLY